MALSVAARNIEVLFLFIHSVMILTLFSLSHVFVVVGAPADSYFKTLAELILKARGWSGHLVLDISVWGIVSTVIYIKAVYLLMFGLKPLPPILRH